MPKKHKSIEVQTDLSLMRYDMKLIKKIKREVTFEHEEDVKPESAECCFNSKMNIKQDPEPLITIKNEPYNDIHNGICLYNDLEEQRLIDMGICRAYKIRLKR